MKRFVWDVVFLPVLFGGVPRPLSAQAAQPNIAAADALFQAGSFAESEKVYSAIAKADAKSFRADVKLAYLALLSNRLDTAIEWSRRALVLKAGDPDAKILMAEALYRQNKFAEAAAAIGSAQVEAEAIKQSYSTLNVAKLQSFAGQTPYELHGEGQVTRLKFLKSEPLPLVRVRVNGGREATFFIDTGGSELLLDSAFAQELGVKPMGSVTGSFAGGQTAPVGNGRVESLTLGGWTLKNVPVAMIPLRSMSAMFGVPLLDGCIGTNVLYQFLATIDYPAGELVLRRKTAANLKAFDDASAGKGWVVPMWMAGDHFIVSWGRAETLPPALFFVDTGLAGAGLNLAESTIKAAGIVLDQSHAEAGQGGGGHLINIPYVVKRFSLGDVVEENVVGLYDGPFKWETAWGFHVDGMAGDYFFKKRALTLDFVGMRLIMQ